MATNSMQTSKPAGTGEQAVGDDASDEGAMPDESDETSGTKAEKPAEKLGKKARKKAETTARKAARAARALESQLAAELDAVCFSELLRAGPGFRLDDADPAATPGVRGSKKDGAVALRAGVEEISDLQERLYAQATAGGKARLLLLVQGMDTSGKGGIMRHVVGLMDPQGVDITAFKAPTAQEKSHPFLWRIRRALPRPGQIGVFDRSQYEDVLIVRVHNLVPSSTWSRRYAQINTFEASAAKDGITMIKVMLNISAQEQGKRLARRLERPDKHWKFNPGDIDERARWEDYQVAYQAMLEKTSTDVAPWYVVPADRKWYARLAVQRLVLEHLRIIDPQWPEATFDVPTEQRRLAES